MSRVSDRDVTTQDSMVKIDKVDLPPRRTERRFTTKAVREQTSLLLAYHLLQASLYTTIHEAFYKYIEGSTLFYCGHEENMHEACGRVKGFCDRV